MNSADGTMSDQLGFYFVMSAGTWVVWRAVVCAQVVVTTWGLTVVNWFMVYSVPWGAVRSVEAGDELTIVLVGGRVIRPDVGEGSLAGAMHGSPVQRALRERIEAARSLSGQDCAVEMSSRFDPYPKQALPVILAGAVLVVVVTALRS